MTAAAAPPIALIGLMGAGKTEVARRIARRIGGRAVDLDARIEAESGGSIAHWFEHHGEAAFREREGELLERAIQEGAAVISCGGGIVLDRGARDSLARRCRTVWLQVSPSEAARRIAGEERARPLIGGGQPEAVLARLLAERGALYLESSVLRVATDGLNADQVAERVLAALAEPRRA